MTITQSFSKLSAVAFGTAVAFALIAGVFATATPARAAALTSAQVSSIISLLQSFGADAATIANVQASLTGGTPTTPTPGTGGACPALSRSLQQGSTGADVLALQKFLNANAATQVSVSGAGSPGLETTFFGPATAAAVKKFQTLNNVSSIGIVGPQTRAAIAAVCGGTPGTPGTPTTPTGPGITVNAGSQPTNSLAPSSASRVPFTTLTLTNNSGVVQTVNGITVERTGLGVDANFAGIVLVDSTNNIQLGNAKTLNSNHQATVGDTFTINPGETKTLTVAGNIAAAATAQSGQIVSLKIVAVNSSAAVSGVLPITGASHTINTTLSLGSVTFASSSQDLGGNVNKNIGDTNVKFTGIRFTAGSAEDLRLYSIRWRNTGTASSADFSNVKTYIDGTAYPTVLDSTGKYYTTSIPGGISVLKGNSIDVYVQGDITGSNSASRTIKMDVDKNTDVYFVGQLYGYGVMPSATNSSPWFAAYTVTVQAGTATTIGKANEVVAQNIAANVSNQPLGGFVTDFKGEAVSISGMTVTLATSSAATGLLTSVSIVDANGATVAGPVDATWSSTGTMVAVFTDSVTFPASRMVYTIKGKVPSTASNGAIITANTTPSAWTSPTGQTSGNSISLSANGNFTMNAMTVKSAALVASLSTSPSSQNIVAGGQGLLFANVQLDASQSGEDVRLSSLPVRLTVSGGVVGDLTTCQLWDGSTALNTGSNIPSVASSGTATTFTLDNSLTVSKGTVKTLALKCNTSTASTGTYVWSINSGDSWGSTGVTSGNSVTETFGNLTGGTMTVASGSLALSVDSSSPATTTVAAGSTGVTMSVLKLRASNEDLTLNELGLTLTGSGNTTSNASGGSSNSGVSDLVQVYLYDGATLAGTVTFTGTNTTATSTPMTVTLTKNVDKLITVKADLATIGTGFPGGIGDSIIIDPKQAKTSGQASGSTIWAGSSVTIGAAGMKLFKSYPTLALDTLPTTGAADGRLMRFKVTANAAGNVGINEFTFTVSSTTGVTITTLRLKGYTEASYSNAISGQGSGGQIGSDTGNIISGTAFEISPTTNPVQVPAGATYYFELTGAVTGVDTGDSIVTTLSGDSSALTGLTSGYNVGTTTSTGEVGATAANFVWSGNSSTTAARADVDWSNGFNIPGLPSGGLIQTRSN